MIWNGWTREDVSPIGLLVRHWERHLLPPVARLDVLSTSRLIGLKRVLCAYWERLSVRGLVRRLCGIGGALALLLVEGGNHLRYSSMILWTCVDGRPGRISEISKLGNSIGASTRAARRSSAHETSVASEDVGWLPGPSGSRRS